MKKIASTILVVVLIFSMVTVYADGISVYVNGNKLTFDVEPQIIDGRTMVPMRKIFEALGAVVTWDGPTQTATGKKDGITVNVSINSTTLFRNGVPISLDVAPALIDNRTLVPARAIAESFNCSVDWVAETRKVDIKTNDSYSYDKTQLSASEISDKVSPAVFYVEVYDAGSALLGSGSGFFIKNDGTAVTNYHVIEGTCAARITTIDGEKYNVDRVIAFNEALDVAIIKISKTAQSGKSVSAFPTLKMADSDNIKAGQTVYAIGSPVGLQNTISNGIISNVRQVIGSESFIQTTAPISHGSSGGVLVNEFGEVLGITSAGIDEAQNIGFAIPINVLKIFDLNVSGMSYQDFAAKDNLFVLEVNPEVIEVGVGESAGVYVHAEGKGDWSLYWESEQDGHIVKCAWGDWLEDNPSTCTFMVTGVREGVAKVRIYSERNVNGKSITIVVKSSAVKTYKGTGIPTYTHVTGSSLLGSRRVDNNYDIYSYSYYSESSVRSYGTYLIQNGYKLYEESREANYSLSQYYATPDGKIVGVVIDYEKRQVFVLVPRN